MDNVHHAEMTYLVKREKELERKLNELREDFSTWKERVQLAKEAGRDELAVKARERINDLRFEGQKLKSELQDIVEQKRELRKESRMPSGQETRRAQALLKSFKESGLVDPDEAHLQEQIEDASGGDDAELEALKAKAGMTDEASDDDSRAPSSKPAADRQKPQADAEKVKLAVDDSPSDDAGQSEGATDDQTDDEPDLDAELDALRAKMGDDPGDDEDIDLDDLERQLSEDD